MNREIASDFARASAGRRLVLSGWQFYLDVLREMIEDNMDFYEDIERGQGVYIVVYNEGKPSEYFFGAYSFD
ncbi:MAG TPA: hypothetical protein VFE47_30440 [Tepidisphaeraceae bacterium]|jgi:hypothetical protein|nr:hypothetical protein [Tepidisphaeraceae bacterium]